MAGTQKEQLFQSYIYREQPFFFAKKKLAALYIYGSEMAALSDFLKKKMAALYIYSSTMAALSELLDSLLVFSLSDSLALGHSEL